MKTQTITDIEYAVANVENSLTTFVAQEYEGKKFGGEKEYTAESLKAGIKAVLSDIKALVRVPGNFVRLSTHGERRDITTVLGEIKSGLDSPDYGSVAHTLDKLKVLIRPYRVRGSKESQEVVTENVNKLIGMASHFEENLNEVESLKSTATEAKEKIEFAQQQVTDLLLRVGEANQKSDEIINFNTQAQQNTEIINQSLTNAKTHEGGINSFAERVAGLQQTIDAQQESSKNYDEQLKSYKKAQQKILDEASKLIEQARSALGYRTAQGISAAFIERYNEDKKKKAWWWLVGAGFFVAGAISIGVWLLSIEVNVAAMISRTTTMLAAISGAWFCAAQYVKHKNTMEDYGYKVVLSQSMVAFLDQLEGEERKQYLTMVLTEIHKDPLRKRHEVNDTVGQEAASTLKKNGIQG